MKSKFILPLFLFLFTVFFSNSQSRYKFEWERLIANTAYNRSSILTDIDGNVYCHTQGSLLSGPLNQISFSKLDKFGNLIFGLRSPYNGSVINGTPMSCTLLSDENFLLLDHEVANNSIVTKMDRNGRVIWQRQFVNKQYQCVREGKDGKIFLGGFYMTPQQFKFRILDQNGQNDLEISPINPDTLNGSLSMVQAFKGKVIYGHDRVSDQALEYYDSLLGVNQITTGNYLFLLDFFDDYFLTNNGGYLQIYDSTLTVRLTKYGDHSPYYGDQFITSEKEFLYVSTSYNPDGRAFVFMTDSNFQTMIDTVWIDPTIRYQGFSNIQEFNNEYYFSFVHGAIGYGPSYMKNYKIDMNKNVVFLGQYDSNGQSNFNSALFEGSSVRYLAVVDTFQARKLVCYSTKSFKAEGTVFYDADSDGVFDSSEYGIPGYKLLTLPDSNFIFTDHNGHYEMYADSLELIEVLNVPNTFCYLTTATSSYQYIGSQAGNAGMNFGLMYYEEDIAINTITPTVVTCIDPFGYNVKIKNLGSNPWKAVLKINKDINSNFEGLIGNATFTVAGNLVQIFSVDTVFPGQELNLFLKLTINNPSLFNPIQCSFSLEKPDGFDLTPSFSIISPILCSYDPNDKLVEPKGVTDQHIVDNDTVLTYTIRFQNTGNYFAKNISLLDTLDNNLDLATFEFLASSHNQIPILRGRVLNVNYQNIYLPDSSSDYFGSMGYFCFKIKPKPHLNIPQPIDNKAYIYFDFNQPVITNNVRVTVGTIPVELNNPGQNNRVLEVAPNPTHGFVQLYLDQKKLDGELVFIYNNLGVKKLTQVINGTLDLSLIPSGIYTLQLQREPSLTVRFVKI